MKDEEWEEMEDAADERRERHAQVEEITSFMTSEEGKQYLLDVGQAYAALWTHLSKVDVSLHVEDKNGLDYLSWASAWGFLMEFYPDFRREFGPNEIHPDGSTTVHCTLWIRTNNMVLSQSERLPVTDYNNKAILKPNAFDINTAQQRCFVKCAALFGLGHSLYLGKVVNGRLAKAAGKEAPTQEEPKAAPEAAPLPPVEMGLAPEEQHVGLLIEVAKSTCKTEEELNSFWRANKKTIDSYDTKGGDYKKLITAFTALKEEVRTNAG